MDNLQVGTKVVVTHSTANAASLAVGSELVIREVPKPDEYRTADGWNLKVESGVLVACGLNVRLKVLVDEPVAPQDTTDYKRIALMQHLSCAYDEVEHSHGNEYEAAFCDYLVLTDDEADEALDEALESILDDVILPDLDEALQSYFDRDAWKRDAEYDGRGHHLSSYDGCEEEAVVDGVTYYIYRTN